MSPRATSSSAPGADTLRGESLPSRPLPSYHPETVSRGPQPTIHVFTTGDPREFATLTVVLENLLPEDATERFKYRILVDHLKYEEVLLRADFEKKSAER